MIHKEGYRILSIAIICTVLIAWAGFQFLPPIGAQLLALTVGVVFLLMLQFFRNPSRTIAVADNNLVYVPADGRVVVIEETEETEYFNDKRIQISIFMSPLNVHVNRAPFSGEVKYVKYHPGKYLVAWHPKSSTENERSTVVIDNGKAEVLLRQIAGAAARRIRTYVKGGEQIEQGADFGFITFGSRVDVFLPLDAKVKVKIGDTVRGNKDIVAEL
ncbi:MAG: phosphatidylserine decarboxylase family protein [Bacteroidota bacterium]